MWVGWILGRRVGKEEEVGLLFSVVVARCGRGLMFDAFLIFFFF